MADRGQHDGRITLDYSRHSTVVCCDCGWREVTASRPAARVVAAAHLTRTHHNAQRAHDLIRRRP